MAITNHLFVVGVYDNMMQLDRAVSTLHDAGFQDSQIAIDAREKGTQSVLQTLEDLGVPEGEAQVYQESLSGGQFILVIRADERRDDVVGIMRRNGGNHVWYPGVEGPLGQIIPLREERLQTQKQVVVSGEVRIHKRVIIEERTITVKVAREEIEVERISFPNNEPPLSLTAEEAQSTVAQLKPGESIRISLREEQIFIEKRPIIKEEVVITKQVVQDVQHLVETVRKEVPRLESDGDVRVHTDEQDGIPPLQAN